MLMRVTDRFVDRLGAQMGEIFSKKRKLSPKASSPEKESEDSEPSQ